MSWEVRIMRSATSFFDMPLMRMQLRRAWPLLAAETLLWIFLLPAPLPGFLSGDTGYWIYEQHILESALKGGVYMAAVFGLFFAILSFFYLFNTRATNCCHALPLRRETLFMTSYLTGLFCQLAALLPAFALTAYWFLPSSPYTFPHWDVLGRALGGAAMEIVFFYSFAVFCAMFSGQALSAAVFYLVGNSLIAGIELMLRNFAGEYLYGYVNGMLKLGPFSPFFFLVRRMNVYINHEWSEASQRLIPVGSFVSGYSYLYVYAAAGLVFAALALALYRRRKSEMSGSVVAISWAVPVFQYGVAFCAALVLGQASYILLFGQYRTNGVHSFSGTIMCMLVSGLLGYYISEALVKKSLRVLHSGARGACIVALVLTLTGVTLTFDLTGYEGRVPDVRDIETAYVSFGGQTRFDTTDAATLSLITEAHRAIVADKSYQQAQASSHTSEDDDESRIYCLSFDYTLKSGVHILRDYRVTLPLADLGVSGTTTEALNALYTCPTAVYSRELHVRFPDALPDNPNQNFTNTGYYIHDAYSPDGDSSLTYTLTARQAEAVCRAAMEDCARPAVAQDIFSAQENPSTADTSGISHYRYVELYANVVTFHDDGSSSRSVDTIGFEVTPAMTSTLAVLEEIERTCEPDASPVSAEEAIP